ncbi:MAG TPA: hypothetical protein VMR25_04710 [Planctomycetaceae bacterium]|jgi:hypothetical protein|nr:hypothetical protein [Planctomycetaceae bacterium]
MKQRLVVLPSGRKLLALRHLNEVCGGNVKRPIPTETNLRIGRGDDFIGVVESRARIGWSRVSCADPKLIKIALNLLGVEDDKRPH